MERQTFFADVIVPVPVPNLYTYRVPHEWNEGLSVGSRVIVPFGKSKLYTGIVRSIHETPPTAYTARYLDAILDEYPIVHPLQLQFWDWIGNYYMANPGDVMNAALPSGLKLSSETRILPVESPEAATVLTGEEQDVLDALRAQGETGIKELESITGKQNNFRLIRNLRSKGCITLVEEIQEKFKPKMEVRVRFSAPYRDDKTLTILLDQLEKKAPKQVDLLMELIRLSGLHTQYVREVRRSEIKEVSGLGALVKKGILEVYEVEAGRLPDLAPAASEKKFTPVQEKAFRELKAAMATHQVTLLHGVTSSGKTELYSRLIREMLSSGKQVLYLIPEIAITIQLVERLRSYFGDAVGVYHSRFNENERVEIWNAVLSHGMQSKAADQPFPKFSMIVGARSAMFLPWKDLGLVIIDEEHDSSFKQQDPSPRYHARDAAIYLSSLFAAKVILGSATPSIETFKNAREGKYGMVSLSERHGGTALPRINVVDIKNEWKQKTMLGHFSPQLMHGIKLAIQHNEQVILFQNRRGFAPVIECQWCGWRPVCPNCDVSLVYHKTSQQLRCHYCGSAAAMPVSCHACGDSHLKLKGLGTEQVEEELGLQLPGINIARMDLDTTRSRQAHFQLMQDFSEGHIHVLVGTQMITKGLDFERVSLVGILDADGLLGFPDFRAHEKAFQLMEQVAGRAGRRMRQGDVIIQTRHPEHPLLQLLIRHDYGTFCKEEELQRAALGFPPYTRMIEILLLNKDAALLDGAASLLASRLKAGLGKMVQGPELPIIPRVRNLFRQKILIRIGPDHSASEVKRNIQTIIREFRMDQDLRKILIQIDVDPY